MAINDKLQLQLIKDLLVESFDSLDRFDRAMLALEKGEGDADTLNNVFRIIHTIKGSSGCIGLNKIESVAHVGESLLSLLRDGKLATTPELVGTLLEYSDALKAILRCLEQTGGQGDVEYSPLLEKLRALQSGPAPAPKTAAAAFGLFEDDPAIPAASAVAAKAEPASPQNPAATAPPKAAETDGGNRHGSSVSDTAIRVDVAQLDRLMNLVGELVLARNQIVQYTGRNQGAHPPQRLAAAEHHHHRIAGKRHEDADAAHWQRLGQVSRASSAIWPTNSASKCDWSWKAMKPNWTAPSSRPSKTRSLHIVRNSMDHGIEPPDARRGGRQAGARLAHPARLPRRRPGQHRDHRRRRRHQRGARQAKGRRESGLVTADQAPRMSDREAFNLIFLPGFSTAEKVTNVSGRGVGMDVVKTNIEKIGGSVDVLSEVGQGHHAQDQDSPDPGHHPRADRHQRPANALPFRRSACWNWCGWKANRGARALKCSMARPCTGCADSCCRWCISTARWNSAPAPARPQATPQDDAVVNIVVLQADGRQFGLVVDEINDTEEIVVKPLGKQLKGITCFAGATIMGDGRVALILDVLGLAQNAKVISEVRDHALHEKAGVVEQADDKRTLLVFNAGHDLAWPSRLSMVARLEEFPRARVERSGSQEVVQYRGQILPLIHVAQYLPNGSGTDPRQRPDAGGGLFRTGPQRGPGGG